MRQLFIFIISLYPLYFYAETTFNLKETKEVYLDEITSEYHFNPVRFPIDYRNDNDTSGSVRTSCWGSFDNMKNSFNSDGLYAAQVTFNDENLATYSSFTALSFYQGYRTLTGLVYFKAVNGFNSERWTLYCTAVSNELPHVTKFRPSELSYTILNLSASSIAFPYIRAPTMVDLKKCLPNNSVEAVIPLTVGFEGNLGKGKQMYLTVKSNDLPESFEITVDGKNILNTSSHTVNMAPSQKDKQIESYLKGICPSSSGEYLWNAEYIYTIQ